MSADSGRPIAPWRPRVPGNTDLGNRLVWSELQVKQPRDLPGHGTATLHGAVADQIASTALKLDDVQARLVALAAALRDDLQRIEAGHDTTLPVTNGILRNGALDIDLLVTRRTELHRSLTALISVYKELPAFVPPPAPVPTAKSAAAVTRLPPRQEEALRLVGSSTVTIFKGSRGSVRVIASEAPITVATIDALIGKGLVDHYARKALFRSHDLTLTPEGQSRYEALATEPAVARSAAARARPVGLPGAPEVPAAVSVPMSPPAVRSRR
ncbi:hypothetical protein [Kitasatospora griseola]|uniref:hypothetical protein n=1 Tax=Kitasatospora griseola TaxID=2064 RepID=UPI001671153D|nr:hypothetical protein [Kitasatospora griseola]GGR03516.1 hypothetical protein GCM10010195_68920 [Kitasatospora griseola]